MPAWLVPLAISGISALSGLLANRKQKAAQDQTSREVTNIDTLDTPEYDPQTLAMRNALMDQYLRRMYDTGDFFSGYRAQGLQNINATTEATQRAIENILASRGLSGTTAGNVSQMMNLQNRATQQSSLLNQIPLLADQRAAENLSAAGSFWDKIPVASRKTGQTITNRTGTSVAQSPGNPLGGMFASLGTTLAGLYGQGAFGNTRVPTNYPPLTTPPGSPINYNIVPQNYRLG